MARAFALSLAAAFAALASSWALAGSAPAAYYPSLQSGQDPWGSYGYGYVGEASYGYGPPQAYVDEPAYVGEPAYGYGPPPAYAGEPAYGYGPPRDYGYSQSYDSGQSYQARGYAEGEARRYEYDSGWRDPATGALLPGERPYSSSEARSYGHGYEGGHAEGGAPLAGGPPAYEHGYDPGWRGETRVGPSGWSYQGSRVQTYRYDSGWRFPDGSPAPPPPCAPPPGVHNWVCGPAGYGLGYDSRWRGQGGAVSPHCPFADRPVPHLVCPAAYQGGMHLSDGFFADVGGVGPAYLAGGGGGGYVVVGGGGGSFASARSFASASASARVSAGVGFRMGGHGGGGHMHMSHGCGCKR